MVPLYYVLLENNFGTKTFHLYILYVLIYRLNKIIWYGSLNVLLYLPVIFLDVDIYLLFVMLVGTFLCQIY